MKKDTAVDFKSIVVSNDHHSLVRVRSIGISDKEKRGKITCNFYHNCYEKLFFFNESISTKNLLASIHFTICKSKTVSNIIIENSLHS